MPSTPTAEEAAPGTLASVAGAGPVREHVVARARLVLVLSALAIGLLTTLSFDPGPASVLEVVLGTGACAAFLLAITAALVVLGSPSRPTPASVETVAAVRSGRVLAAGFLAGMTLMIVLGCVAGLAALGEPAANAPEPAAPFESTIRGTPAGGVDLV